MPDCDYCDRSFDAEDAYLDHLAADHEEGDLGRIDRRRVEDHTSSDGPSIPPVAIYAVAAVALLGVAAATIYYVVGVFSAEGPVHEHGTLEVTIDGEPVDFDQLQYRQPRDVDPGEEQAFHFHPGSGERWHMHPNEPGRLTLAEAMSWLGIEVTADSVAFEDAQYSEDRPDASWDDGDPGTTVEVRVNGDPADPASHELHGTEPRPEGDGDHVEIVVETSDA